jgi:hypothetical protein
MARVNESLAQLATVKPMSLSEIYVLAAVMGLHLSQSPRHERSYREVYHTYAALLEVNDISPHQVLFERKIDDFSHKDAGDAIAAVAARFPDSDVSVESDLDASS